MPLLMLHTLRPSPGSTRPRKRVGRGSSAGGGTTAGRGTKGQHARTGKGRRYGFEGGQTPLLRRQPKLGGFIHPRRVLFDIVNIGRLDALPAGSYDAAALFLHHLVQKGRPVKLLGKGTVTKKFELTVHAVSKGAKEAIQKAGGTVNVVPLFNG